MLHVRISGAEINVSSPDSRVALFNLGSTLWRVNFAATATLRYGEPRATILKQRCAPKMPRATAPSLGLGQARPPTIGCMSNINVRIPSQFTFAYL